ncbi:MAG TPA: class I adenylate-forming enzyme family protein [Terriglobales bacterium]|jgi:long-chain acyl-CoA synthetase|nr:class I adenylate-forming enzyme family protein [Terriglobales bacterium]
MAFDPPPTRRTQLYRDPRGLFVHDVILEACRRFGEKTAIVDHSIAPPKKISYAAYGEFVERLASQFSARSKPGEVIGIFLFNSWEFCVAYHAATLAGCIPTLLNPTFREREVRYQLENSGAVALISDTAQLHDINLRDLPKLRDVFTVRGSMVGSDEFAALLEPSSNRVVRHITEPQVTIAALPYSSGTTGLPKGVMLSHTNLVTNIFQFLAPGEQATYNKDDVALCCLPLYHIYGLNVVLNPLLAMGGTLVLMPRFEEAKFLQLLREEYPTFLPLVPPLMNCLCNAAEQGTFAKHHRVRCAKSGAAPLAPDLAWRFTDLTGIRVRQGYGMTEASPVTHIGYIEPDLYRPDSIGPCVAQTECRLVMGHESFYGELVMRGPQMMLGYWNAPDATDAVLRDGWYWSGDMAGVDSDGFYRIVDRVKEMIKYKGFAIAPAEVEAVLLEHPMVRDCGIVGRQDLVAGEVPCAFVVLRDGNHGSSKIAAELCGFVSERLTGYKQPREVRFVPHIPRNPSGKILRRKLREALQDMGTGGIG